MLEKTIVVGSFQCNCRIFVCERTGEALVVDPGDEPQKILREIDALKSQTGLAVQVKQVVHTHGHLDHIGGTRDMLRALDPEFTTGVRIGLHRGDEMLYQNLQMQGRYFGIKYEDPLPINHYLEDEENFCVGDLKFSILHTPGHSPGSICLRLHEDSRIQNSETLMTGDTLFHGSVGRTDLWGGDQDLMFKNIRERILTLESEIRVCPGHGPNSTIGKEKHTNPFLN